eukprot:1161124-Pelagomonas_calceolata.AAC.13
MGNRQQILEVAGTQGSKGRNQLFLKAVWQTVKSSRNWKLVCPRTDNGQLVSSRSTTGDFQGLAQGNTQGNNPCRWGMGALARGGFKRIRAPWVR